MSKVQELIATALFYQATMEVSQDRWQKEILEKWEESKNYPRKKKKKIRKRLLLEWNAATWSPYDKNGNLKF